MVAGHRYETKLKKNIFYC